MGLFKKKDEHPDSWKEKYFQLLDNQEQFEKQQKANEELLCKTIVRFALAVKGFSKPLDPHLDRIRELLKSGVKTLELKQELEVFSNALMAMDDESGGNQLDASLLFDFLTQHNPGRLAEIENLRQRYTNREFINHQRLFPALAEVIAEKQQDQQAIATGLELIDCKAISRHMIQLLESADLPPKFIEDGKQLKIRLQSEQALGPVLEDAMTLLLSIKTHLQVEQQEMAEFLASLTEELTELGMRASGVSIANEEVSSKRASLDNDVAAQMDDLQKKSETATALEPLKQLVSNRLHKITQQIQAHHLQEQLERDKNQNELKELVHKIKEMESETVDLRAKLDVAQHRATRDPLTHLPNRLAFEERLADDLARARRYATPLTMAVWDIDFFKKINDTFGHKSGDKALVIIAKLLSTHCRETDFVARIGGEEFVMLLPETEGPIALKVLDKLRTVVEKSSFNANGQKISITVSCGVTQYVKDDTSETLFVRADEALYQAKQNGRNQCVLA